VDSTSPLPQAVDLHQRIRAITTGVILLSRFGTLGMVGLSIVAIVRFDGYTNKPVATVIYVAVVLWSTVFLPAVARRDPRDIGDVADDVGRISERGGDLRRHERGIAGAEAGDGEPAGHGRRPWPWISRIEK
jgi:hypothetical protein